MMIWQKIIRVLISALFGGIFYSLWLAGNLLLSPQGGLLQTLLWISAPFVTALGFASGLTIAYRWSDEAVAPFRSIFAWPLVGCIVGAGIVYWFGPMLIVFAMLALGTVSIAVEEIFFVRSEI
jgi:hypothetical protein